MTDATINKNIERSSREMRGLIVQSKRKLLELEALLSLSEINGGKSDRFNSGSDLFKSIK